MAKTTKTAAPAEQPLDPKTVATCIWGDSCHEVDRTRERLIKNLYRLSDRLKQEAARLEEDPTHTPYATGYVASVSTSQDIDRDAAGLVALLQARYRLAEVVKGQVDEEQAKRWKVPSPEAVLKRGR